MGLSLFSVLATAAHAGQARLPLQATLCYPHDGIQRWTYTSSDNVRGGVRDRTGLVEMRFSGPGRSTELLRVPVRGLRWTRDFRHIVARGEGGEFLGICGTRTWHGIVKEGRCRLEGRVVPASGAADGCNEGAPAYLFVGDVVVTVE